MMRAAIKAVPWPLHRHSLPQLVADGLLLAAAYLLSFALRFENGLPHRYLQLRDRTVWWAVVVGLAVLIALRAYQRSPRYSSQRDYLAIARGMAVATALQLALVAVVRPVLLRSGGRQVGLGLPDSIVALYFLLGLVALVGWRVVARTVHERGLVGMLRPLPQRARTVLIVGAGDGGRLVLREILRNRGLGLVPVGFLDDDPRKRGLRIDGVRVRGNTQEDLPRILDEAEPEEVLIAIPSAPGTTRARVVRECRKRNIPVRTLPTVFELLQGGSPQTLARQMRRVRVEDLLGREPVHMELERVGAYLAGQTVLVTGAGGSIGSELCRQIARVVPRKLLLLDHSEGNLFAIQRELEEDRHLNPQASVPLLCDCRDRDRLEEVFRSFRPTVVFHAAAYKHVPLMETNPLEAVRNNAFATRLAAELAGAYGASRFVLVSTDKAVAPATVMGASKLLAELALDLASANHPRTVYKAVRFGNVLGSSGSVVPIFERQIARGGPLTVTDERMSRYFMTIPEAVQLIIRAGSLDPELAEARDRPGPAQLLVLDMGEPVKIIELARTMIELSGLEPGKDIAIEVVGRRPGEKLEEQLFNPYEHAQPTPAERLLLARRAAFPPQRVEGWFAQLEGLAASGDTPELCARLFAIVGEASTLARQLNLHSSERPLAASR